jgi:formylglycine-generating enzyme required for sulfatase activity
MTLETGRPFGRYRLIRDLGRGGEATVHLAEDPRLDRLIAVKIFPPAAADAEAPERFRREISMLARIDHPDVCRLLDAGVAEGAPFIAMSYVEGRTLAQGVLPGAGDAIALAARIAAVLQAVHASGVVHCDVKPGNIVVTDDGRCVLLDFGVSRLLSEPAHHGAGDRHGGTLPYLAPECFEGAPGVQADVFGLGAVLFELVTGRAPHVAPTRAALVARILNEEPPLARTVEPGISRDLEAVLARALHRDPSRRYSSMAGFAADLDRLRRGERVEARRYGPVARGLRWARRRPAGAALAAFGLAFVAIAFPVAAAKNRYLGAFRTRAAGEAASAVDAALAAAEHLERRERLADRRRLEELEERSRKLVPPSPEIVPALTKWLEEAEALVRRLPEHERTLDELRSRGTKRPADAAMDMPGSLGRDVLALRSRQARLAARRQNAGPAEARALGAAEDHLRAVLGRLEASLPPAVGQVYASPGDAWHDATLSELVASLRRLADPDPSRGAIADVRARIREARTIADSLLGHREAWSRARTSIADQKECPLYGALVISPQPGLVPLRRNPDTGLWEFLHLLSGAPPDPGRENVMTEGGGIILVLIPPSVATVGARRPLPGEPPDGSHVDAMAAPEEAPIDQVRLDPYFISKFELTRGQWERAGGRKMEESYSMLVPALLCDWFETRMLLRRIGLELPTEAQWEHAARGGTATSWWTGSDPASLHEREVFDRRRPQEVGALPPNGFGLHDVAGNVSEWCRDVFARYEDAKSPGDGERAGLDETEHRIVRGGAYASKAPELRSSRRQSASPFARRPDIGVRPMRRLDP